MMKKVLLLAFSFLFFISNLTGQEVRGVVLDSKTEQALAYVNIGVVGLSYGTITNEAGEYILNCEKLPNDSKIQISMIGYEPQTYSLADFKALEKGVRLVKMTYELGEVSVKWKEIIKKVGTTKTQKMAGVCGWGGTDFGKGHELGLLLNLGNNPVKFEDINLKIRKHSFDTIMFRLHVRSVKDGLPSDELLTKNIYLSIYQPRGWQKIDLSEYDIMLSGEVVLSIEWIKVSNVIPNKLEKMNGSKHAAAVVLFETNQKQGTFLMRRGSAAKWKIEKGSSPGFYITVRE